MTAYHYGRAQLTRNAHSHVEPEQAAQMMNQGHNSGAAPGRAHSGSNAAAYNKPVPLPPQRPGQDDRYGRQPSGGYGQAAPGAFGAAGTQQGYNDYNRPPQRYDSASYNQHPNSSRYGHPTGGGYSQQQAPPPARTQLTSPPPTNYGQGPPPQGHHDRPQIPQSQRPPTVAPPSDTNNDRDALWPLFLQVDKDRSGQLSEEELRRALVNGDYTAFDPHTVKMMIRMFDTDRSGTINFDEFCGLWGFLAAWRGLFDRFDVDRSGNISLREFEDALVAFGYRLSPQFVQLLFGTYARSHSRGRGDDGEREKVLSFDLFVQACISLKRMTDVFKKFDSDRDGYITLSFEEFLTGSVTFLKRKGGLFKKAHELSVLCSVDVAVIIFGHNKKLYEYSSSDINEIIARFQYYGGAHEHKGPADFADKGGGGDDDEDDDGGDEGDEQRNTPVPPDQAMMAAQMQNHPGFQHVRHGTPNASPPMHAGAMPPQFVRGPSPLPPNTSRPSSRTQQHPGHVRRISSNLAPQHMQQSQGPPQQPNYAYTPNPPFYNPRAAAAAHMGQQRPLQQAHQATYPPPYPPPPPQHPQMQHVFVQEQRRASGPPAFPPQPPPQANMAQYPSSDHLQPPQHRAHPSPSPQQGQGGAPRHTPSPQPPQHQFASPQPRPLPASARAQSIFTPIDDSRSMLAQHWGSNIDPRMDPPIKLEEAPRSASVDVAVMQRGNPRSNGTSPRPPPARQPKSQHAPQRAGSSSGLPPPPGRSATMPAKRPTLKVQIPSEQSGDEGGATASGADDSTATAQPAMNPHQPPHDRVVLPPPSPSAGALLSAGPEGPRNPFARPAPPMSTNPHAMNREAQSQNHIETPISALPSRFMSDNLLPSPSQFFGSEFFGGRSADGNLLPSPLNFQTPVVGGGQGWIQREEDRKRQLEDDGGGGGEAGDVKRARI
ncbi:hypothetical protein LTR62_004271 [Meristemomyces frigidus]|uniref:EF-hand n=1 Tax=Meristemomyces frigidus TaxID=1508187 RepID=A0AAN7YRH1_9PEZI|nr:hypothetical protein LTR62_004271 [Meristemomyces frigidus]